MRWTMEQAQHAFGVPTPRQACAAFLDYHLRDGIAEKITCLALICDAASGLFFAGQARQLFDHLTCPKTFLEFTADEGADAHCQAGAERLALALARICNWLDDTSAPRISTPAPATRTGNSAQLAGARPPGQPARRRAPARSPWPGLLVVELRPVHADDAGDVARGAALALRGQARIGPALAARVS